MRHEKSSGPLWFQAWPLATGVGTKDLRWVSDGDSVGVGQQGRATLTHEVARDARECNGSWGLLVGFKRAPAHVLAALLKKDFVRVKSKTFVKRKRPLVCVCDSNDCRRSPHIFEPG